jgi:hypothetical protein
LPRRSPRRIACTTIDLDDDVLRAAKELARREKTTAGAIISALTRKALNAPTATVREVKAVHGFRPFSKRGAIVTNVQIDKSSERRMRFDEEDSANMGVCFFSPSKIRTAA